MEALPFLFISIGFLAVLFVWIHWIEPNWFHLRPLTVKVRRPLPRPLRILHLSDFHFTRRRYFVERFFDRLATLEVDFVFLTGDLIDEAGGIAFCAEQLKKLKPKKGIYAVLGNHDYRIYGLHKIWKWILTGKHDSDLRPETEQLKQALIQAGVRLLINQNISLPLADGHEIALIGIDDPITGHANLNQSFQGVENGALRIALVHTPIIFSLLRRRKIDIAFSGHTHGGQIRLPGVGPVPWVRFLEPIIDSTDRYGFIGLITRGMGAHPSTPFRFFCRPEAVLVRLEGS